MHHHGALLAERAEGFSHGIEQIIRRNTQHLAIGP